MSTGWNLPGPLEQVTAAYRGRAARPRVARPPMITGATTGVGPPMDSAAIVRRADQFAEFVVLSLDEPTVVQSLHEAVEELRDAAHLADALCQVVRGAMLLMGTELGNVQLVDPDDGSLVLVSQSGFGPEFLDAFAVVDDQYTVCGRAARQGAQAVVTDVRADPALAAHQGVFRAAGVRAVQSTPLVDYTGRTIGIISTHAPKPGAPADRDLRIMQLYSHLAGEAIARHLGMASPDDDPAGNSHDATVPTPAGPLLAEPPMSQFMSDTINRLLAAGLSLAGARQRITDPLAARQMQAGLDTLDQTIRSIQLTMFELALDHHRRAPRPLDDRAC